MARTNRVLNTIDLFCGPGGLTCGFKMAGEYKSVFAVEMNPQAADTYEINNPDVLVLRRDIRRLKENEILEIIKEKKIDLVMGGPPCEGFSMAGRRNPKDKRNTLFWHMIRIAKTVKAKAIMLENVPGLVSMLKGKILDNILKEFKKAGFNTSYTILNASNYGVPQLRKRFFLFAFRKFDPAVITESLKQVKKRKISVKDAISDLPPINPGREKKTYLCKPKNEFQRIMKDGNEFLQSHRAVNHRKYMLERFSYIKQGEGMKEAWSRMPDNVKPKKMYAARCRRLHPEKPSHTVTSHCLDELIHPYQNRAITPREAARLQSFPDRHIFVGDYVKFHGAKEQDRYEQIGDAIPPLLAKEIALVIKHYL